jgi:ABC-type nitrate/sulfonate/bicarbonate transport system substrate-binding protein
MNCPRPTLATVLVLACLGLAGCDRSASSDATAPAVAPGAAGTVRFVDGVNMDVRDVPLLMAFDELTGRGYRVERTYIAGNTLLADVLARGDADVAVLNNQTAWAAIAKGADIRTVSEFAKYTGLLIARADIRTCRDLHGRRVGLPATTGFAPLLFRLYMSRQCAGIEPQIVAVAEASARAAALLAGRLDAVMVPGEELLKLQQQSTTVFHAIAAPASQFPGIRVDGVVVRREWAEKNPAAVTALLGAQLRAHRAIRANPQILYDEAVRRLSLDLVTVKAIGDSHLRSDIWDVNGGLTAESIQSTIDILAEANSLAPGLTAAQVSDLSYLNTVLSELGRVQPVPFEGSSEQSR